MTYLLDTHTIIWAGSGDRRLGAAARAVLADESAVFLVSAASAWEIATKVRLGKLPEAKSLEADFLQLMSNAGFVSIPVTVEDALRSGRLRGDHRDPWDRMIAAQALAMDIPIISNDKQLDAFGIRRLW
jgi:PIN domain nuclease of toxin-antitoxin system